MSTEDLGPEVQELRHTTAGQFAALGDALNRVHADVQQHRGETRAGFEGVDRRVNRLDDRLDARFNAIEATLQTILGRLPARGE